MTPRKIASVLLLAALFAVMALVLLPAKAAPGADGFRSAREAEVYVRGWLDAAAPPPVFSVSATCTPSTRGYACVVVDTAGHCRRALLTGFRFGGPLAPTRCAKGPPS